MIRQGLSKAIRAAGQGLDQVGKSIETNAHIDRLQPSTSNVSLQGVQPKLNCSFVAPSASIVGNVSIGKDSSVWYNAVVRSDMNKIDIGDNVSIGDGAMIHSSRESTSNSPTNIGSRVMIGVGANIHGCTLEDECEVGDMAVILDKAVVKKHAKVAAGAVVEAGTIVGSRELWAGSPAKLVRQLTAAEINNIAINIAEQSQSALDHAKELGKDWYTIVDEDFNLEQDRQRSENYYQKMSEETKSWKLGEVQGHAVPGRIFGSKLSGWNDPKHTVTWTGDKRPGDN